MRALTLVSQEEVDLAEEELVSALAGQADPGRSARASADPPAETATLPAVSPYGSRPSTAWRVASSSAISLGPVCVAAACAAPLSPWLPVSWVVTPLAAGIVALAWPGGRLRPALAPLAGFLACVAAAALSGTLAVDASLLAVGVSACSLALLAAVLLPLAIQGEPPPMTGDGTP